MSNIVLYRKYRPQQFSDITGQAHVVQTLKNALANDAASHAYLFTGARGVGKTTIARLLAKALNCRERADGEPCNTCEACKEIGEDRAIDLIEIDAASHRGIDEMRELKEGIRFAPTRLSYKVYIIDEAHQLTKEAANALLKTLEEPPSHAVFVLATTEVHRMIPTIVSRCQRFDFKKFRRDEILSRLRSIADKEDVPLHDSALELIAVKAAGSLRDAESILDQVVTFARGRTEQITAEDIRDLLGVVEIARVRQFVSYLLAADTKNAVAFVEQIVREGDDIEAFTNAVLNYLRQALVLSVGGDSVSASSGLTEEDVEELKQQIEGVGEKYLRTMLETIIEAENKQRYATIPQLPLELAAVELTEQKEKGS